MGRVEFVYRVLATAVGVWVSTVLPGIALVAATLPGKVGTLIAVAFVFGLVNGVIKPLAKILGCVFYLVTLGLIGLVVNALLFWLTGWLSAEIGLPFVVDGFWPGFWGAIVVSLVAFLLTIPLNFRKVVPGRPYR
jgi:putative membrane protein